MDRPSKQVVIPVVIAAVALVGIATFAMTRGGGNEPVKVQPQTEPVQNPVLPQNGAAPAQPSAPIVLANFENSLPGYKLDQAQSGTTKIDDIFPPSGETKERNKAVAGAEDPVYLFVYNSRGLTFASITGFQFQDPQEAGAEHRT